MPVGYDQYVTAIHRVDIHEYRTQLIPVNHADFEFTCKEFADYTFSGLVHSVYKRARFMIRLCSWVGAGTRTERRVGHLHPRIRRRPALASPSRFPLWYNE